MKTRIRLLFVFAALWSAAPSAALAQGSNPSNAPFPVPGLFVAPPTVTSGSGPETDGYWCYPSDPNDPFPTMLPIILTTKNDVSDVYEWRVELRRWQTGDDPKECPGDYVDSQEYYPLSLAFSYVQPQNDDPYWRVDEWIDRDTTRFPRGTTSTFRLVAKIYRQDFEGNTTIETVYSEPFYLAY